MALFPWLERRFGGDAVVPDIKKFGQQGLAAYGSGGSLADEGVRDIRGLGDGYQQMLRSGSVLPDSTASVLKRARGQIKDQNIRDTMASASRLRQARIAGRGRLSAEAAQEYLTEAEAEANRGARESELSLSGQEADLELQETNNLRDRLSRAREMILNAGQFRQQLGQQAQLAALLARLDRHKAIGQTIAGITGAIPSGSSGGYSG